MNAETRAKEIVVEIIGGMLADGAVTQGSGERWANLITSALRQAQNDKLEEAATALTDDIDGSGKDPYEACLLRSAAMIRALKKD